MFFIFFTCSKLCFILLEYCMIIFSLIMLSNLFAILYEGLKVKLTRGRIGILSLCTFNKPRNIGADVFIIFRIFFLNDKFGCVD